MSHQRCRSCVYQKPCRAERFSWLFFTIGLISTTAIRIVTVLMNIKPIYGKVAWYIGVSGFFIFFLHQFHVHQRRAKLIEREHLLDKVNNQEPLKPREYELMSGILCQLKSEKERFNFLYIFVSSAITLLIAIYFDFFK